jgi:transposase-like protein
LQHGHEVSHETIRVWAFRFAPMVSELLRSKRRGQAGRSWYIDETDVKVSGRCAAPTERSTETAISWTPC